MKRIAIFSRWSGLIVTVLAMFASAAFRAAAQTLREDFSSFTAGSDATPAWEPQSVGWEVVNGAYVGDSGVALWRAVPFASAVTFACDVTVLELRPGDWLTVGLGIDADDKNYWALNLVVAPENRGRQHTTELQEAVDGVWLAQSQGQTRLKRLPSQGDAFNWRLRQAYRMEISLTPGTITGHILDGTKVVARFGYELTEEVTAVRTGRPVLRVSGLRARFDNAVATVTQTAPEPVVAPPIFPAWISRPGQAIAKGTSFFATAEVDGRWWLVDPEGKPFFGVGTDHVSYRGHWCEKLGYSPYLRNVQAKFGSEEAWGTNTIARLKAWGFNELPVGHSPSLRHRGLPHILFASLGSSFARREWICEPIHWTGFPDVFSPHWESHCRIAARKLARESRGDPWCIGTFIDNELEWYGKRGQLVDEVFQRGPQQASKQALWRWMTKEFGRVTELNNRLGTHYADEEAFLSAANVPPPSAALTQVRDGFLALIAERYFSVAAQALREADPDHLVLGCRFAGRAPEPALAAAGKYNDVFTFNTYPRVDFENVWAPDGTGGVVQHVPRELSEYYAVVRKPMIITEWSFPALDSGLPCQHGAGMRVDTQAQKAACYRIFANAMADLPFMVGYHYFMWADEPALGISSTFPEDSNYGLVNEKNEPYPTLVNTAAEVNRQAAVRHAHSTFSGDLELRKKGTAVEVANPNAIASHGWLRVSAGGRNRIEPISLSPRQVKPIELPAGQPGCVELQNWDGTTQRSISGRTLGSLEVANVSAAILNDVPVLLDTTQPVAALLSNFAPGQTIKLDSPNGTWTEPAQFELRTEGVTWYCNRQSGSVFDHVQAGDLSLGRLVFAVHLQADGRNEWAESDRILSVRTQEQRDAWLVEAVLARGDAASAASFRAAVRLAVFKRGGLVLARPLWVENSGTRDWRLAEVFWFCRPAIGGSPEEDVLGGAQVPNYYRAAQFWTDTKLGGCFGALGQSQGWQVTFWKSSATQFHPDARFSVEQNLRPGARWTAEAVPYLWIFAGRDAQRWRAVARLAELAASAVLPGDQEK